MRHRRFPVIIAIAAAFWPAAGLRAQRTGSTVLAVTVRPEAHLSPSRIALQFIVSPDGAGDVTSQAVNISAWVRALPDQQIHLTAGLRPVNGPSGTLPASAIKWSGSVLRATAGAQSAICSQGSFTSGPTQELVSGWQASGTLTCAIVISLAAPPEVAPGLYTATVRLTLNVE